jgi:hypothetical protein
VGTVVDEDNPISNMGVSHLRVKSWYANLSMRGNQLIPFVKFCIQNHRVVMGHCKANIPRPIINNLHTYKLNENLTEAKGYADRCEESRDSIV